MRPAQAAVFQEFFCLFLTLEKSSSVGPSHFAAHLVPPARCRSGKIQGEREAVATPGQMTLDRRVSVSRGYAQTERRVTAESGT